VHLGDGGAGEGLLVEGFEHVLRLVADLLLEELVHLVLIGRRVPVQQAAELAAQRLTERARDGGEIWPNFT
jgi:hypothetical protein